MSATGGSCTVEVLHNKQAVLAEGPVYDHATNELIWVDILGNAINFTNVDTKQTRCVRVGAHWWFPMALYKWLVSLPVSHAGVLVYRKALVRRYPWKVPHTRWWR